MGTLEKFHSPSHLQQIKIYLLYTLMIIDFEHSFKNYHEILDFYGIWEYHCPKCGATHSFHRHAVYSRNLIVWESDGLVEKQMKILRLQCKSCSSTHAVLTPDIIPFFIYSLEAFLALITMCLDTEISVLKTEKETGTSYQLLYQFLRIFHSYRKRLLLFFAVKACGLVPLIHSSENFCSFYICIRHDGCLPTFLYSFKFPCSCIGTIRSLIHSFLAPVLCKSSHPHSLCMVLARCIRYNKSHQQKEVVFYDK